MSEDEEISQVVSEVEPELFYVLVDDKGRTLPQEPALVKPEREFY